MYSIIISFLFYLLPIVTNTNTTHFPAISNSFPLKWKTNIGKACFRSNIIIDNDRIYVPSNGHSFMDSWIYDKKSGVYCIESKTGKVIHHFGDEPIGDMDVSGLLSYDGRIYFGNDNEEFICTNKDGKILWRIPVSGDIEHEPVLLKNNKEVVIVYATEMGEVVAVNPIDGKKLWSYFTPDFWGWMPGDNRAIFKVHAFFSNSTTFFRKPLVVDLNGDHWEDLVYFTYSNEIYAINGYNGNFLWHQKSKESESWSDLSILQGKGKNTVFSLTGVTYSNNYSSESNFIKQINASGVLLNKIGIDNPTRGQSLNSINLKEGKNIYCFRDSIVVSNISAVESAFKCSIQYEYLEKNGRPVYKNRSDYCSLMSNTLFNYKGYDDCVFLVYQTDPLNTDNGIASIVSLSSKKVIAAWELPSNTEMVPVIADIDKDGLLDVLISGGDDFLYCYNLGIKTTDSYTVSSN